MRKFLTLLVGVLCIFTLNAQVNTMPKPYAPTHKSDAKTEFQDFRRETTTNVKAIKIQAVVNEDEPIADGYCRVILTVGDIWGDGSGYQMLITQNQYAPNAFNNADPFANYHPALYEMFEYKLPANADGTLGTSNVLVNNSAQVDIPAGYYYFGFPSPTTERMWLAGGTFFEWDFEEKVTYSFQVIYDEELDRDNVNLDALAYGIPAEITDFTVTPAADEVLSCELSWTNPTLDVMGENLEDLLSVTIMRNGEIIRTINNPVMGASETWTDVPETNGFYTYSIYATSSVRYGPKFTAEEVVIGADPCANPISEFPYSEGFEDEKMPYCWGMYDIDEDGKNGWKISSIVGANDSSHSIFHEDIHGAQDGWLVMPKISLPAEGNHILRFFEKIFFPGSYEKNSVLISDGSPNPADNDYVEIWVGETPLDWVEHILSLKEYNGKDIYIAFRYEGNYAHCWYIDDIKVENFDLIDAEMLSIESPVTGLDLGQETVTVKIRNNGSDPIENASVSFFVNRQLVATETITEPIPSLSEYTYTFEEKANLSDAITHLISATITVGNDEDEDNNSKQKEVRNYGPIAVMGVVPEITTCNIPFYDEGVEDKYEKAYQRTVLTFLPEEAGKRLSVEFSMLDLAQGFTVDDPYQGTIYVRGDSLYIYEGINPSDQFKIASLGGTFTTDDIKTFKSRSADGALTFIFDKVGSAAPGEGWDAVIKCFTPEAKEVAVMKILSPIRGGNAETDVMVRVRNYGGETIDTLPIAYSLNGGTPVVENADIDLEAGLTDVYVFTTKLDLSEYSENYELEVYTMLEGDADPSNDRMTTSFFHRPSVDVYAFLSYMPPSKRITFKSNTPDQITDMNSFDEMVYPYGVFYFDEHIYVITVNTYTYPMTTTDLIKFTPDWTEVSRVPINQQVPVMGATYDYDTEKIYLTTINLQTNTSGLYTLNMTSGEMTLISDMGEFIGGIACNLEGVLYGVTSSGRLVDIDKTTGSLTEVHQLTISNMSKGFNSLTFDLESGRLFHNNYPGVGFCEIDIPTGTVQSTGNIGDGSRSYVGMYIPYDKEEVALKDVENAKFAVYPNPTNGLVNILALPENAMITLRNIAGKVIDVQHSNGRTSFEYDVPAGIYLLEIKYEGKSINQKLIVK